MEIRKRILLECRYIISLNKKIDELVKIFKVSKSTIYKDLNERLYIFDKELYFRIKDTRKSSTAILYK